MWKHRELALAVLASMVPLAAQASPLTEPSFVTYFSQNDSGSNWHSSAGYLQTFVHWSGEGPEWSRENISWVRAWSGGDLPDMSQLLSSSHENIASPPWGIVCIFPGDYGDGGGYGYGGWSTGEWAVVPEPGSGALVGAFVGALALGRRTREQTSDACR